jgi:hypothetical protein
MDDDMKLPLPYAVPNIPVSASLKEPDSGTNIVRDMYSIPVKHLISAIFSDRGEKLLLTSLVDLGAKDLTAQEWNADVEPNVVRRNVWYSLKTPLGTRKVYEQQKIHTIADEYS